VYIPGSLANGDLVVKNCFTDDYTSITTYKDGLSKIGFSFIIGIISVILAYMLAIPLGTLMALKKDKLVDKLGTIYIVFIIAVPSLAYIFLFKAIGGVMGLPTRFDLQNPTWLMYILPIISLALPSVASLMKWLRRYMIDQMNSDYVKFARSGGLSEGEIFRKHILKNAIIPIVHGIPGSVLGALVGAIITERVYVVPGTGNLLTEAINKYDNGVIVGVTLFYALLSVISIILGDILMSLVDPRISFTTKREK
jgi:oligopeptide transport system permease protein